MAEERREIVIQCECGRKHLVVIKYDEPTVVVNANLPKGWQPREG